MEISMDLFLARMLFNILNTRMTITMQRTSNRFKRKFNFLTTRPISSIYTSLPVVPK